MRPRTVTRSFFAKLPTTRVFTLGPKRTFEEDLTMASGYGVGVLVLVGVGVRVGVLVEVGVLVLVGVGVGVSVLGTSVGGGIVGAAG